MNNPTGEKGDPRRHAFLGKKMLPGITHFGKTETFPARAICFLRRENEGDNTVMICNTILDALGHTPIVRLNRMNKPGNAEILVKFEGLNVGGSIKSRTAWNMIQQAEKEGLIHEDTIIVEPTGRSSSCRIPSARSAGSSYSITGPK